MRLIFVLILSTSASAAIAAPCTQEQIETVSDLMLDRVSGPISDSKYDKLFNRIALAKFNCQVQEN